MRYEAFKAHKESLDKGTTTLHDVWSLMLLAVPGAWQACRRL